MNVKTTLFLFIILSIVTQQFSCQSETVIKLQSGMIEGKILTTENGSEARVFQGIPYAKPPVGDLRFRRPDQDVSWNGTLQCKQYRDACAQTHYKYANMSEDCLHVNVFAHRECKMGGKLCPVLYLVHGGANEYLSSVSVKPEIIVDEYVQKRIVFVNVGYRLGIFGFWSTGTAEAEGNWALEDIVLGAEWIQREIEKFGGDPNRVTIWGYSSSSTIISLLSLSPRTEGLFNQMVPMSALSRGDYTLVNDVSVYWQVARNVGCVSESLDGAAYRNALQPIVQCMRQNATPEQLMIAFDSVRAYNPNSTMLPTWLVLPKNDGPYGFFPTSPLNMMQRRRPIKAFLGATRNELGPSKLQFLNASKSTVIETCQKLIGREVGYLKEKEEIIRACIFRYAINPDFDDSVTKTGNFSFWTEQTVELMEDFRFFAHTFWDAWTLTDNGGTVYLYSFDFEQTNRSSIGTAHGVDIDYLVELWTSYDERDLAIKETYLHLFTNFVLHGNPTPEPIDNVRWPVFQKSVNRNKYLSIDLPLSVKTGYHKSAVEFWNFEVRSIQDRENGRFYKKYLRGVNAEYLSEEHLSTIFYYFMLFTCYISFLVTAMIVLLYCSRVKRYGYVTIE